MVLICNNNIITIDQFHLNRCVEKNEIKNIYLKLKYEKENEPKYIPYTAPQNDEEISRRIENYSTFSNKSKKYDYRKSKR
jgi:hypothetical protein